MNLPQVETIAKAVLYEGYMLYPYRPSAIKNQHRFNFGVVYPEAYGRPGNHPGPSELQTQCLGEATEGGTLQVCLRFLHLVERCVGRLPAAASAAADPQSIQPVASLEVDEHVFQPWREVAEKEIWTPTVGLRDLCIRTMTHCFELPAEQSVKRIHDKGGNLAGAVVHKTSALRGSVSVSAETPRDGTFKLTLHVANLSHCVVSNAATYDDVLSSSFLSTHLILGVEGGAFVSLLDPPPQAQAFASACSNSGLWPILVGEPGARDTLLCSPIILYDYPQIAPESPGDLFDATEIDEILSLRILALTDEEKREMRASDERARAILERTESLSPEQWSKLHGAFRSLQPLKETVS